MQLRNGKRVCSNLDLSNSVKRFKLRTIIDEMPNPKQVDSPDWDVNREDFTDSSDSSPTRLTIDETAGSINQQLEEPKPEPETVPEEPKPDQPETVPEEPKPEQPETVQTERKPTAASCVRSKPPKLQCSDNLSARDIMERLMDYVSRMPLIQNEATVPETTNQTKPETDIVTAEEPKPESVESKPETVAEEPKPESVESKPETVTAEPKPEPEPETVEPKPEPKPETVEPKPGPKPETVEPKPEPEPVPYDSVEDCDPDEFAEDMESESDSSGSEECEDSEDEYYESSD
jgi:hypothetical protein